MSFYGGSAALLRRLWGIFRVPFPAGTPPPAGPEHLSLPLGILCPDPSAGGAAGAGRLSPGTHALLIAQLDSEQGAQPCSTFLLLTYT